MATAAEKKKTAAAKTADIVVVGNADQFQTLSRETSKNGSVQSVRAMEIQGEGCLVNISTVVVNKDGSLAVAETATFVRDVRIVEDVNGGYKLVSL